MNNIVHIGLALAMGLSATIVAAAGDPHADHMAAHGAPAKAAMAQSPMSEGEIKKIDKQAGKVTIKHGPLVNLDMPSMTMVFTAKEPSQLDAVKVGDKIRFVAEKNGRTLQASQLETVK